MVKYTIKRIGFMIVTYFLIMSLVYMLLSLSNYDTWVRGFSTWELIEFSFDDYKMYLHELFVNESFGRWSPHESIWEHVTYYIPTTFKMNFYALIVYAFFGLLFGMLSAYFSKTWFDKVVGVITVVLGSVPGYVSMLFLMLYFGYHLEWFPGRFNYYAEGPVDFVMALTLPIIALSLGPISMITRTLRGDLIEEMNSPYIELVVTKGFTRRQAMVRHALRNTVLPVVTEIPRIFSLVLSMSFVIEISYNLRGAGFLFYQAVIKPGADGSYLNINVELAVLICGFYVMLVMIIALISDLSYAIIDPRIKMGSKK